jgi:U3 small nucleolar RNA-associated protein 18
LTDLLQIFFLDSGHGVKPDQLDIVPQLSNGEEGYEHDRQPAWIDSDDERISVSLASNTRLRKLRNTETEDIISGREYIKRLRRQYERLHPTPEWVRQASGKPSDGKRRRRSSVDGPDGLGNEASDSDMSVDDEFSTSSTQPLAELLRTAGSLTRIETSHTDRPTKKRKLRPEVVDIQKTKSVTGQGPSSVDSLQFHSHYPLLLSSGPASTIYIHHISPHPPNPNPLLTSLHMKHTPLHTTAFCPPLKQLDPADPQSPQPTSDQTLIFLSSRRRYFHTWSLTTGSISKVSRPLTSSNPNFRSSQRTMERFKLSPCGRYMGLIGSSRKGGGCINVLSTLTMQYICSCRVDSLGGIADIAWWGDGDGFAVVGKNGEVSEYDMNERRVIGRWIDEGAVGTTVIALGGESGRKRLGGDRWAAIGSSSGIVNIYDRREWSVHDNSTGARGPPIPRTPKPVRTLDQLTTPTSHLVFSADGQMLVMASRWRRDALRIVHLPSCTVYRNWPTDRTPLGRVSSVALSPDGGLLAVGNEQGKIRLWEIRE